MCLFFMGVLALSGHKEDRFLLPMFPIFILWICLGLDYLDKNIVNLKLASKVDLIYSHNIVWSDQKDYLF